MDMAPEAEVLSAAVQIHQTMVHRELLELAVQVQVELPGVFSVFQAAVQTLLA